MYIYTYIYIYISLYIYIYTYRGIHEFSSTSVFDDDVRRTWAYVCNACVLQALDLVSDIRNINQSWNKRVANMSQSLMNIVFSTCFFIKLWFMFATRLFAEHRRVENMNQSLMSIVSENRR